MKNHTILIVLLSKFADGIILRWLKSPFTPVQATQVNQVIFNKIICCLKGYGDYYAGKN